MFDLDLSIRVKFHWSPLYERILARVHCNVADMKLVERHDCCYLHPRFQKDYD